VSGDETDSLNPNGTPSFRAVISVKSFEEDPVWTPTPPFSAVSTA
jgi:hypothetical protein